nr:hypothetical protein Itr_chr13CG21250 [Ipomoea trifida]
MLSVGFADSALEKAGLSKDISSGTNWPIPCLECTSKSGFSKGEGCDTAQSSGARKVCKYTVSVDELGGISFSLMWSSAVVDSLLSSLGSTTDAAQENRLDLIEEQWVGAEVDMSRILGPQEAVQSSAPSCFLKDIVQI